MGRHGHTTTNLADGRVAEEGVQGQAGCHGRGHDHVARLAVVAGGSGHLAQLRRRTLDRLHRLGLGQPQVQWHQVRLVAAGVVGGLGGLEPRAFSGRVPRQRLLAPIRGPGSTHGGPSTAGQGKKTKTSGLANHTTAAQLKFVSMLLRPLRGVADAAARAGARQAACPACRHWSSSTGALEVWTPPLLYPWPSHRSLQATQPPPALPSPSVPKACV